MRDALEKIGSNKRTPAPSLPEEDVAETTRKYREALERLVPDG